MRDALVELAKSRPTTAKASLKLAKTRAGTKPGLPLGFASAAKARALRPAPLKVALRPRMREVIAVAR